MTVDISDELYIETVCDYFDLTEKYFRFNKHGEVYEFNFEKHSKMFNELCGLDAIFEYVIEDSKYRFTILNKDLWLWAKIKYGF